MDSAKRGREFKHYYFYISNSMSQLCMVLDSLKLKKKKHESEYVPSLELCREVSVFVAVEGIAIRKTCHLRIVLQLIQDSLTL